MLKHHASRASRFYVTLSIENRASRVMTYAGRTFSTKAESERHTYLLVQGNAVLVIGDSDSVFH